MKFGTNVLRLTEADF